MLLPQRLPTRFIVIVAWGLMVGCATAQAPVTTEPTGTAVAPPAAVEASPPPNFQLPAQHLEGGRGVLRLCELLRQSDGVSFKGNAVEQARQREIQEQRRTEASDLRYEVSVPSAGFTFEGYDLGEGKLRLADKRFAIEDGIELDRPSSDEAMGFVLSEDAAERLLQMHAEGKLSLRLVFSPQGSQMRPDMCIRQSAGRIIKLGSLVFAAYVVGPLGAPLAKYETEAFAQEMATITLVRSPKASVGKAIPSDSTPITSSAQATIAKLDSALLACYREALIRRSTTQGTVIVGITVGKDGHALLPRMEMSTINDEGLVACAVSSVGKLVVPTSDPLPNGLSVPVTFGDAAP